MSSCCLETVSLGMEAVAHLQLTDRAVPNASPQSKMWFCISNEVSDDKQEQSKLPVGSAETELVNPWLLQNSSSALSVINTNAKRACLQEGAGGGVRG